MKFPNVEQIATPEVVSLPEAATVHQALERMTESDNRAVVVEGPGYGVYGVITINDIIRLRARETGLDRPLRETGYRHLAAVPVGTNVLEVLKYFGSEDDYLCVVDAEGHLDGIISYTDIVTHIDPQVLIEQQRVGDILARNVLKTAAVDTPLGEVFDQLANVSDAVILIDGGRPAGIITTKDAVRTLRAEVDFNAPASRYMTAPLETVHGELTVREALNYIREKHFKRIVIHGDGGGLLGMINQRELVDIAYSKWAEMLRNQADELRELVELLERKANRLARMAETDKLTGVYNRAKFEQELNNEAKRCDRYHNQTFTLALMDLDHFKAVNDHHGHLCGDDVLKTFTRLIQNGIRDLDLFARWGGEEFVLMMPNTGLAGAHITLERLRATVAAHAFEGPGQVTMSVGLGEYRKGESPEELVARTDAALYRAKHAGRNRVEEEAAAERAA